jgi:deoxyribonuclease V
MARARRTAALTPTQAVALQRELAARVVREDGFTRVSTIAGVDTSIRAERVHAVISVFSFPGLEPLESARHEREVDFPYVPGLLGFREVPALLAAFERLSTRPDLVLVDGHGLAHPRRFGIACHLGVELDLPTIGCGKSLLVGEHREPGPRRGARTRLVHRDEVVGYALRTRERVKPLFVSIGHRTSLATAVRVVLACTRGFRLPEPIRAADREAGEQRDGPG